MAAANNERVRVRVRGNPFFIFHFLNLNTFFIITGSQHISSYHIWQHRNGFNNQWTGRPSLAWPYSQMDRRGSKCCLATWIWRSRRCRRLELFYKTSNVQIAWDLSKSIPKCVRWINPLKTHCQKPWLSPDIDKPPFEVTETGYVPPRLIMKLADWMK